MYVCLENEIDGDAFLLLSEEQIKQLIKVIGIGPQVKFSQKHKVLCASLSDKDKVTISDHNIMLWLNSNSYELYLQI